MVDKYPGIVMAQQQDENEQAKPVTEQPVT